MVRYLGYACINESIKPRNMKTCRLKTYKEKGNSYIRELIYHNLDLLEDILIWNQDHGIKFFRISSDIFPLVTHPELKAKGWEWDQDPGILERLNHIKVYVESHSMRLSMHPDQYTVLNSIRPEVVEKALIDLEYHADLLDHLGGSDLIIHVGGVYGQKDLAMSQFVKVYKTLSSKVKKYLRLENDDRSYTIHDVLSISKKTKCPIIFDYHHHRCHKIADLSDQDIKSIIDSWQGQVPKVHLSSGRDHDRDRRHHEYIQLKDFMGLNTMFDGYEIDVMLECKRKDLALIQLREAIDEAL